jgi:hypothetical protein
MKCKVRVLMLMMLLCWASQSSTQPTWAKRRAIGICVPWDYIPVGSKVADVVGAIGPNYEAAGYFTLYEKREVDLPNISSVKLTVKPKHGVARPYKHPTSGIDGWRYLPNKGFTGNDRVQFVVEVEGKPVYVNYFFKVTKLNIEDGSAEGLCKTFVWKISSRKSMESDSSDSDTILI